MMIELPIKMSAFKQGSPMPKQLRKREFQYKRIEVEAELGCPRKYLSSIKRLNIRKSKKNNLLEAFDDEGNIKMDDEVEVWFNHIY